MIVEETWGSSTWMYHYLCCAPYIYISAFQMPFTVLDVTVLKGEGISWNNLAELWQRYEVKYISILRDQVCLISALGSVHCDSSSVFMHEDCQQSDGIICNGLQTSPEGGIYEGNALEGILRTNVKERQHLARLKWFMWSMFSVSVKARCKGSCLL